MTTDAQRGHRMKTALTFVVIFPNYYGKGQNLAEAVKAARKAGWSERKRRPAAVYAFDCPQHEVTITADIMVRFNYPEYASVLTWEELL